MATSDGSSDPIALLRLAIGFILLFATVTALVLAVTGIFPKALLLVGGFWSLYGTIRLVVDHLMEPGADVAGRLLANGGLMRVPRAHGEIETLAVRGEYQEAAERWFRLVAEGEAPAVAMLKRAELLAGPLKEPGTAAAELTNYRDGPRLPLTTSEDVAIGLALVDIYEERLQDHAKAMFELRRLLDLYPGTRHGRRIRATLNELKLRHFGDAFVSDPAT